MRLGNPQPNSSLALELDTADPHLGNDIDREMLCTKTVNFGLVAVGDVKLPTYRMGHCFVSVRCRNKTPTGTCTRVHVRDAILDLDSSGAWGPVQVESWEELCFSGDHHAIRL